MIFGIFFRFQYSCVLLSPCTDVAHLFGTLPGNRHYPNPPGGGVLAYKSLMGMCRWMGSHFHDWSDYNGVAFSIELLEWGRKFSNFGGK